MLNRRPLGPLCWVFASLLHLISIFSGLQINQGSQGPLRPGVAFPTTSHPTPAPAQLPLACRPGVAFPTTSSSPTGCSSTGTWLPPWLRHIIIQRLHDRPLDLWNRMFNRHQAEITVMQFTGHSHPVHHSVVAQWDLHLVQYYKL